MAKAADRGDPSRYGGVGQQMMSLSSTKVQEKVVVQAVGERAKQKGKGEAWTFAMEKKWVPATTCMANGRRGRSEDCLTDGGGFVVKSAPSVKRQMLEESPWCCERVSPLLLEITAGTITIASF